jgi:hypothetical protein
LEVFFPFVKGGSEHGTLLCSQARPQRDCEGACLRSLPRAMAHKSCEKVARRCLCRQCPRNDPRSRRCPAPQQAQQRPWLRQRLRILQPAQPLRFRSSWQRCSQKCCNGCSIRFVTQRATYNCLVCQQPRLPIRSSPRLHAPKSLVCACSATQLGRLQCHCLSKSRRAGFRRPCECLWRLRQCPG